MSKNPLIDAMVDDFLRWPLPDSVCADLCATKQGPGRVGTNLLTAIEADAMFKAVVLPKLAVKADAPRFLDIDVGGHRIGVDCRDDHFQVICNGAIHAQFNRAAMGDLAALKAATLFAEQVEASALKYPKAA